MFGPAEGSDEEGNPADEADVDSKQDGLESAIWRLTAGNGMRPAATAGGTHSSGGNASAQPLSERRTAAGRIDFVLQACSTCMYTLLFCFSSNSRVDEKYSCVIGLTPLRFVNETPLYCHPLLSQVDHRQGSGEKD